MSDDAIKTDKLVSVFIKMRQARSELAAKYKEDDDKVKESMRRIENELIRRAQEQGVEGFTCDTGTTYLAEELHLSIADDDVFFGFMEKEKDMGFLERRPSITHVQEWEQLNKGNLVPGLNRFRQWRMRVRAASAGKRQRAGRNGG